MVEYHSDILSQFQGIVEKSGEKGKFGGCLGIRMNLGECPVICFGQEKSIFKQYIFTKKMWNQKGKLQIVLKDKEYVVMILALQSQDFGSGYALTDEYIQNDNEY